MGKERFEIFRGLLRGAICNRSQSQFAQEAGISVEHLNRMLNETVIHRPTKQTLQKIASVAKNGITYKVLEDCLNAEDPNYVKQSKTQIASAQADFTPTFEEQAEYTYAKFQEYITTTVNMPVVICDIADFIYRIVEDFQDRYPNASAISYEIGRTHPYFGHTHPEAEKYVPVFLNLADRHQNADSQMILYYKNIDQKYLAVQYLSMAVADIHDIYGMPSYILNYETSGDEEAAFEQALKMPYIVNVYPVRRFTENYKEDDLVKTIFGTKCTYPITVMGFGFWLPGLPSKFAEFVYQHLDTIVSNYKEQGDTIKAGIEAIWNAATDTGEKNKEMAEYFDRLYSQGDFWEEGWQDVVAVVITEESGFPCDFWKHQEMTKSYPELSDTDCVLIEKKTIEQDHIARETLINLMVQYGRELGIKEVGDILLFTLFTDFLKQRTYSTEPDEETEEEESDVWESTPLTAENKPKETGFYRVILKDGRQMTCLYVKEKDHWVARHREWSDMITEYEVKD